MLILSEFLWDFMCPCWNMLYSIWRYLKMIAQLSIGDDQCVQAAHSAAGLQGIINSTIRIARLKLLFIAAKAVKESNVDKVKYLIQDARTAAMISFLKSVEEIFVQNSGINFWTKFISVAIFTVFNPY